MKIFSVALLILIIVLTIFYFSLYHRIFTVYYLKNMVFEIVWELFISFFLAMVTIGLLGSGIVAILKFLGRAAVLLLKIAAIVIVIGGVGLLCYAFFTKVIKNKDSNVHTKGMTQEESKEKKSKCETESNTMVCPECGSICDSGNQFCDQCGHAL